jgi:phosphopantothenoylcysteine synthetase/decarboxylase
VERVCLFVICAAPLARRAPDIAQALVDDGWTVVPVATPTAAADWVDHEALERITGLAVRSTYRTPDEPKVRRESDLVLVSPATFNTIGKLAHGIADDYALGVLAEALGAGRRIVMIPFVNDSLWRHPAFVPNLGALTQAGVEFLDSRGLDAQVRSLATGSGDAVVEGFRPVELVGSLSQRLDHS